MRRPGESWGSLSSTTSFLGPWGSGLLLLRKACFLSTALLPLRGPQNHQEMNHECFVQGQGQGGFFPEAQPSTHEEAHCPQQVRWVVDQEARWLDVSSCSDARSESGVEQEVNSSTSLVIFVSSSSSAINVSDEERQIAEEVRRARLLQRQIERDRVSVKRRAPPVQSSGGVSYPGRPRR